MTLVPWPLLVLSLLLGWGGSFSSLQASDFEPLVPSQKLTQEVRPGKTSLSSFQSLQRRSPQNLLTPALERFFEDHFAVDEAYGQLQNNTLVTDWSGWAEKAGVTTQQFRGAYTFWYRKNKTLIDQLIEGDIKPFIPLFDAFEEGEGGTDWADFARRKGLPAIGILLATLYGLRKREDGEVSSAEAKALRQQLSDHLRSWRHRRQKTHTGIFTSLLQQFLPSGAAEKIRKELAQGLDLETPLEALFPPVPVFPTVADSGFEKDFQNFLESPFAKDMAQKQVDAQNLARQYGDVFVQRLNAFTAEKIQSSRQEANRSLAAQRQSWQSYIRSIPRRETVRRYWAQKSMDASLRYFQKQYEKTLNQWLDLRENTLYAARDAFEHEQKLREQKELLRQQNMAQLQQKRKEYGPKKRLLRFLDSMASKPNFGEQWETLEMLLGQKQEVETQLQATSIFAQEVLELQQRLAAGNEIPYAEHQQTLAPQHRNSWVIEDSWRRAKKRIGNGTSYWNEQYSRYAHQLAAQNTLWSPDIEQKLNHYRQLAQRERLKMYDGWQAFYRVHPLEWEQLRKQMEHRLALLQLAEEDRRSLLQDRSKALEQEIGLGVKKVLERFIWFESDPENRVSLAKTSSSNRLLADLQYLWSVFSERFRILLEKPSSMIRQAGAYLQEKFQAVHDRLIANLHSAASPEAQARMDRRRENLNALEQNQDPVVLQKEDYEEVAYRPKEVKFRGYSKADEEAFRSYIGETFFVLFSSDRFSQSQRIKMVEFFLQQRSTGRLTRSSNPAVAWREIGEGVFGNPKPETTGNARTDQALAALHPAMRADVAAFMRAIKSRFGLQGMTISDHYRTFAQQDELYARGRTKPGAVVTFAKGGESYHNYGLAFDIVQIVASSGGESRANYDLPWDQIGALGKQFGFEWGGDWTGGKQDRPHFQKSFGYRWQELLQMYNAGNMKGNFPNIKP